MKIKYLGHSSFKITAENGVSIVTDPFDGSVGYPMPNEEADIVTSSHDHFDHNYKEAVKGNFVYINKIGNFYIKDIVIQGNQTYHDEEGGTKRGINTVYTYNIDGMKLCHLGDLGHVLTSLQVAKIGNVDVLMIPVGGYYTIGPDEAVEVVKQLNPKLIIPMHYKTDAIEFPIQPVESFLEKIGGGERIGSNEMMINKEELDKWIKRVVVLEYRR